MHAITRIIIFIITSAGAGLVYFCNPNAFDSAFAIVQTCATYFSLSTLFEKIQFADGFKVGSFWTKFWDNAGMVIKKIGTFIYNLRYGNGGGVDPSTPTPQTEVKEENTDNSEQEQKNTPNISLSPLLKAVDIPSNTGTNTIWNLFNLNYNPTPTTALYSIPLHTTDFYHVVAVGNAEWWLENSPTFEQRVKSGELTVTQPLLDRYNAAKAAVETANRQEANRLGLPNSNQSR